MDSARPPIAIDGYLAKGLHDAFAQLRLPIFVNDGVFCPTRGAPLAAVVQPLPGAGSGRPPLDALAHR